MIDGAFLIAAAVASLTLGQQQPGPTVAPSGSAAPKGKDSAPTSGPQSPQWRALSVTEKLKYDWVHLFDVDNVVYAGIGASIDQWRNRPDEWGQGWGPWGERYASHIGYYVVQRSIMFPVQAIDHEDTRFFRSTHKSFKRRAADAALQTVWRHDDSGGMMPAFSEFLGDYGAAAVSRFWWPQRFHNGKAIFVAGTDTILVDAGINILHEFAPDIKHLLHVGR